MIAMRWTDLRSLSAPCLCQFALICLLFSTTSAQTTQLDGCATAFNRMSSVAASASEIAKPLFNLYVAQTATRAKSENARSQWLDVYESAFAAPTGGSSKGFVTSLLATALQELSSPAYDTCCIDTLLIDLLPLADRASKEGLLTRDLAYRPLIKALLRNRKVADVYTILDRVSEGHTTLPYGILTEITLAPATPDTLRQTLLTKGLAAAEEGQGDPVEVVTFLRSVQPALSQTTWVQSILRADDSFARKQNNNAVEVLRSRHSLLELLPDVATARARKTLVLSDPRYMSEQHGPPKDVAEENLRANEASKSAADAITYVSSMKDAKKQYFTAVTMATRFKRTNPQQSDYFLRVAEKASLAEFKEADDKVNSADIALFGLVADNPRFDRKAPAFALAARRMAQKMTGNPRESKGLDAYFSTLKLLFTAGAQFDHLPEALLDQGLPVDATIAAQLGALSSSCRPQGE